MTDKINGVQKSVDAAQLRQNSAGARPGVESGRENRNVPASETVRLTDSALELQRLLATVDAGEPVDIDRVEQIRQAVSEGRYEIDSRQIAERFLALERSLES